MQVHVAMYSIAVTIAQYNIWHVNDIMSYVTSSILYSKHILRGFFESTLAWLIIYR